MRKVYGIQLLLLMLAISILAVAPVRSQQKKPVVIAIPVGLSGVNSVVAPAVVQSAQLAADELNAKGGILGQPVRVVPLDDGRVLFIDAATGEVRTSVDLGQRRRIVPPGSPC